MICNGIDTGQLTAFGELLHTSPEVGSVTVAVRTDWRDGYRVRAESTGIALGGRPLPRDRTLDVDLPEALGGADRGAAPGELLLSALGACVTQAFAEVAAVRGVHVERLRVTVEAELDLRGAAGLEGVRPGLHRIGLGFEVESAASGEVVEELLAAAIRTSPVADTLRTGVPIAVTVRPPSPSG